MTRIQLGNLIAGSFLILSPLALADANSCWNPRGASNLKVESVDGGNTGAFVREASKTGYSGIQSCVTIPDFENSIDGAPQCLYNKQCLRSKSEKAAELAHPHNIIRVPYLYLGFKSIKNFTVETGLEYETGCCYIDHNKKDQAHFGKVVYYRRPSFRLYRRNVLDLSPGKLTQSNSNIRYIENGRFFPNEKVCMKTVLDPISKNFTFHVALNGVTIGGFSNGTKELKNAWLNVVWRNTKAKSLVPAPWVDFNNEIIQKGGEAPCSGTVTWPAQFTQAPDSNGSSDARSVGDHFKQVAFASMQDEKACASPKDINITEFTNLMDETIAHAPSTEAQDASNN